MEPEMREPSTLESTYPFPRYYGVPEWLERLEPFRWLSAHRDALAIPVEEYVEDDQLVIRAELPGIDPDKDVSITMADNVLRINARRREQRTSEKGEMYRSELRYGSFSRAIPLPVDTDADAVTASYSDGILTVRLPVGKVPTGAKRIPVSRT